MYSTLNGKFMYNTVEAQLYSAPNHFAVHFQPILLLLLPVYAIMPSPVVLLLIQAIFLALSATLALLIACEELNHREAILVASLYIFNSSLLGIALFEFHPVSLAVPLFFIAYMLLKRGKMKLFYLTSVLILLTKEDSFLGVVSLSLWKILMDGLNPESFRKNRGLILLSIASMMYGIIVIKVVIPHLGMGYIYESLYSEFELTRRKLLYFIVFNASFGFLTFLSSKGLVSVALPWLESMLSSRDTQTMIGFHYPYMLLPLSYLVAIEGFKKSKKVAVSLIVAGILTSMATIPITFKPPKAENPLIHFAVLKPIPGKDASWEAITIVKTLEGPIYTQPEFYPHLSTRIDVYVYPKGIKPRVILVNLNTWNGKRAIKRLKDFRIKLEEYKTVFKKDGVVIFIRKA
ncbi:DUF2079 domain-containing protein [Pyrococcus abyssi]|uniref:DUF2079 domain-containing protein n=1 Tax=Pyrococcus abyssi TaxID=29292 RepID=UPI001E5807FF|nr:DUF2079 domain-containing protein [Pyrococcus abyssi]